MRNFKLAGIVAAALAATASHAVLFDDANGDVLVPGNPFDHIDIDSVEVTNTLSDITFTLNLVADPVATNWGKYNIVIRNSNASLDTNARNTAWGRNYGLLGGANAFIGSWTDQATNNQQQWTYSGGWNLVSTVTNVANGTSLSFTASLADLGIVVGETIVFDAVTTANGGDDTAVDSLSGVAPTEWGQYVELEGFNYEVVPEPATMTLLGLGAIAAFRKKRKA